MRVKHKEVIIKEIDLDQDTVDEITLKNLYKTFNWGPDYFIKNHKIWTNTEYITSHKFDMDEIVRDAFEEDYLTEKIFDVIKLKIKEKK